MLELHEGIFKALGNTLVCCVLLRVGASPGVLAVHFAFVVVQERHWKDVVGDSSGDELAQHLWKTLVQQDEIRWLKVIKKCVFASFPPPIICGSTWSLNCPNMRGGCLQLFLARSFCFWKNLESF